MQSFDCVVLLNSQSTYLSEQYLFYVGRCLLSIKIVYWLLIPESGTNVKLSVVVLFVLNHMQTVFLVWHSDEISFSTARAIFKTSFKKLPNGGIQSYCSLILFKFKMILWVYKCMNLYAVFAT